MDDDISQRAIRDYCFDYDEETQEINGFGYRKTNPKRLTKGIDLKELLTGSDVMFEICKGYDDSFLENVDPDVYNEVAYAKSQDLLRKRHPLDDVSYEELARDMENVTENGFVKKKIITQGFGDLIPEYCYVTIDYELYKEKDPVPFDSTILRKRPEKLRMDQIETIRGLYYAIQSMKKHEHSRFCINWEYAFGALGCPDRIGPKCNIIADITVIDYVEMNFVPKSTDILDDDMLKCSFGTLMNDAKLHHLNGTDMFKKGEFYRAITSYRKALKILNDLKLSNEEEECAFIKQKSKCLVNLAICYNKVGKFEQACLACQDILAIDSNNVKAFFHYGKASLALSNFPQAKKWLTKAAHLKPFDPDINQELKKLNDKKILHDAMTKKFWEKAFEKVTLSDSNTNENNRMTK